MSRFATIVTRELREALPATIFSLVAFHMVALTETVVLEGYHVDATRTVMATVGALIVAKAILVVEKLPIAHLVARPLLASVAWKTLLFGVVATAFRLLEEVLHARAKHEELPTLLESFGAVSWAYFWVVQMWLVALLFLCCLSIELARIIGTENLKAMLLTSAARRGAAG